jgi:hypothetical protein
MSSLFVVLRGLKLQSESIPGSTPEVFLSASISDVQEGGQDTSSFVLSPH